MKAQTVKSRIVDALRGVREQISKQVAVLASVKRDRGIPSLPVNSEAGSGYVDCIESADRYLEDTLLEIEAAIRSLGEEE